MNSASWSLQLGVALCLLVLAVAVASTVAAVRSGLGPALFGSSLVLFFLVKLRLLLLLRKVANTPGEQSDLPARSWQHLSFVSFGSASLALATGILGTGRPWSWFLAVGAAALGWGYFVMSRQA